MTKEEKIRYYFNQYWQCNNPEMLRCGKLTNLLEKIYKEEYNKVPDCFERKLFTVGENFKRKILGKMQKI